MDGTGKRAGAGGLDGSIAPTYPAYPETMMASSLQREGMDELLCQCMLQKGLCKVDALILLSGQRLGDLVNATGNELAQRDQRNVKYIRSCLAKLRIDMPPPHPSFLATTSAPNSSSPPLPSSSLSSSVAAAAAAAAAAATAAAAASAAGAGVVEASPPAPPAPASNSSAAPIKERVASAKSGPPSAAATAAATTTTTTKPQSQSEHERMLRVLREFPAAYEQYISEHGGPSLPSAPETGSRAVATKASAAPAAPAAAGAGAGAGAGAAGAAALQPLPRDQQDVGFLCGLPTPGVSWLWSVIADALSFFGVGAEPKDYQSVDQIVDEFCASTGLPAPTAPFRPKTRQQQKVKKPSPLGAGAGAGAGAARSGQPDAPPLSPLSLRPMDWAGNKEAVGAHLRDESRRLFRIFAGLTRGEGIPTFNWEFKLTKSRVTVHQAVVPDSPWAAIKSDCIVHADKHRICRLITDDDRSHEYDDSVEGYDVSSGGGS